MTSNLGANAPESAGFSASNAATYEAEVTKFFRPEFFNRLDQVITFRPLGRDDVEAIARKELAELAAREGLAAANIQITWSDQLIQSIAREGYDRRFGARPMQRVIENRVAVPLARWRVANPKKRDVRLHVDVDGQGVVVVKHIASLP
jgi:ATP-dependent Clp protease ATP-binding subunit ClpC